MVHVAEDLKALAEDILSSARARQGTIGALKSWVAGFLASSRMERLRSFRDTHARLSRRVGCLAAETRAFLSQCDEAQWAVAEGVWRAADEQRRWTADAETVRLEAFLPMRDQIARGVTTLVADTRGFLRDCHARRRAGGNELRQQLANGDSVRRAAFGQMHGRIAGRVAELTQTVRGELAETRHSFMAGRAAWKHLAGARSAGRRTPRRP
jgi:hypothetical protein